MSTTTLTLTEFLLERIAEDEEAAGAARILQDYMPPGAWDLDRVLAECEAKRQIVEILTDVDIPTGWGHWTGHGSEERWIQDHYPEILKWLALPYAGHPDYRESWKP